MLGLGLGLPFSAGRGNRKPPQLASLRFWGDSADVSGADVASWPGRAPGSATFSAAGGERPDASAGGLVFNGSDRMAVSTAALGFGGVSKATVAFWVKLTSAGANDCIFSTDTYPNGLALANNATRRWIAYINGSFQNSANDYNQHPGVWQFVALCFDGTQGTDALKLRLYTVEHGQDVATLEPTTGTVGLPAALAAASANAAIADLPPFNRIPPMAVSSTYWYTDAVLTAAEVIQLAKLADPQAGALTVLPLGDSITVGVGDTPGHGGYREYLLDTAGSVDAWKYVGPNIVIGAAPNSRQAAVTGSKVDAHLTQYNAALAAGWNPSVILYCGGTNDITAGEVASLPARYAALFAAFGGRRAIVHVCPIRNPSSADTATANGYLAAAAALHPNITIVDGGLVLADLADSVHPNAGGYVKMAAAYWAALEPLL